MEYLTRSGGVVLLDDDVELSGSVSVGSHGYAQVWNGETVVLLHRVLLGLERGDRRQCDHINRNKLDNRRSNLRIVTPAQNSQNTGRVGRRLPRGVSRSRSGRYLSRARLHGRTHCLGTYDTVREAEEIAAAWRAEHMTHAV